MAKTQYKKKDKRTWAELLAAFDPKRFSKKSMQILKRAGGIIGHLGVKQVRDTISTSTDFEKNASLTVALKGSNEPLKGTASGGLFQAITFKVLNWDEVFVGVLRSSGQYKFVKGIHDGVSVPVTEKMRAMFFYLWTASQAVQRGEANPEKHLTSVRAQELFRMYQDWRPLRSSTEFIHIPARPFFTVAFADEDFQAKIRKVWESAIRRALTVTG